MEKFDYLLHTLLIFNKKRWQNLNINLIKIYFFILHQISTYDFEMNNQNAIKLNEGLDNWDLINIHNFTKNANYYLVFDNLESIKNSLFPFTTKSKYSIIRECLIDLRSFPLITPYGSFTCLQDCFFSEKKIFISAKNLKNHKRWLKNSLDRYDLDMIYSFSGKQKNHLLLYLICCELKRQSLSAVDQNTTFELKIKKLKKRLNSKLDDNKFQKSILKIVDEINLKNMSVHQDGKKHYFQVIVEFKYEYIHITLI